jgi:archaeal type IV pilus assembly protein PilA
MAQKRRDETDEGISAIIGEIMMLAITVMVFGLLVVAVNAMMSRPDTIIVEISAANNSTTVYLTHTGGDSVSFSDVSVIVNGNEAPYSVPASDVNGNGRWEIGETLYVANPADPRLNVMVYDSASNTVIGDFNLR